jgi:hypothetical protein
MMDADPAPLLARAPSLTAKVKGLHGQRDGASLLGPKPPAAKQNEHSWADAPPLMAFSNFPLWLREGPWKPGAMAIVPMLIVGVVVLMATVIDTRPVYASAPQSQSETLIAAFGLLWTALILVHMLRTSGVWPMVSFTMLSWLMLAIRFGCFLAAPWSPALWLVAESLRGPALINSVFLSLVWWIFLVPLITYFARDPKARRAFLSFNLSFFLVNVHALNVPLGLLSDRLAPRALVPFDLGCTLVFSVCYVAAYLFILDPRGIHLYIILSPRSHCAPLVYGVLLAAVVGIYRAFGGGFALSPVLSQGH